MNKPHLRVTISQKALIVVDGKLLLTLEGDEWELPGGRVEEDELDLQAAVKRELQEELSLEITPLTIFSADLYHGTEGEVKLALVYQCELLNSLNDIKMQVEEISDWKLYLKEELEDLPLHSNSLPAIRKFLLS